MSDIFDYIEMFNNGKRQPGSSDELPPTENENQFYQRLKGFYIIHGGSLLQSIAFQKMLHCD